MAGRNSAATDKALRLVSKGVSMAQAAKKAGIAYLTIWRAVRRAGITPVLDTKYYSPGRKHKIPPRK